MDAVERPDRNPNRLCRFLEWLMLAIPTHIGTALQDQFKTTMLVERLYAACSDREGRIQASQGALEAVLKRPSGWRNSYLAERLILGTMSTEKLQVEAKRRLIDAETLKLPSLAVYKLEIERIGPEIGNDQAQAARLYSVVDRLVNDAQWGFLKQSLSRTYSAVYVQRLYCLFSAIILLFFWIVFQIASGPSGSDGGDPAPAELVGFWIAVVTGVLGAAFSMITKANNRVANATLDDLRSMVTVGSLGLRLAFGAGAATILYFLFEAELIQGTMFPKLESANLVNICSEVCAPDCKTSVGCWVPTKDFAALMVWSFLAGFSESLVPSFLGRIENSGGETGK